MSILIASREHRREIASNLIEPSVSNQGTAAVALYCTYMHLYGSLHSYTYVCKKDPGT